jgi:branched-chain amino acid transport system ATP-binding protein
MQLLEVNNLSVRYGQAIALRDISLEISPKECVGVIGPNGAGKTTLLRAISGHLAWDGDIVYKNNSLNGTSTSRIVGQGIVQAPEGRHLFAQLTVAENLEMGAYLIKSRKTIAQNLEFVLELFPRLEERTRQLAGTLSGGEQQMVCIGRALMASPELLMLDEPSFGLAPLVKDVIGESIERIRKRGVAILLVEQDANMAFELSERIYVLEGGVISITGASAELSEDPRVKEAYLGID